MPGVKPTIYVSNFASHRTEGHHGPGRKLTIMAKPPGPWAHGDGRVDALIPQGAEVELMGALIEARQLGVHLPRTMARYRDLYSTRIRFRRAELPPTYLAADFGPGGTGPVRDGDTLCCACSRADAAAGRCHRVWAAEALANAGWRVVLDGEVLPCPE